MKVRKSEGAAWVTFDRPEVKNCFRVEDYQSFGDILNDLSNDRQINCIILRGEGDAFCTGGDLSQIRTAFGDGTFEALTEQFAQASFHAFTAIERCSKVVIAGVDGHCQAGGLSVALCSDIIISTRRSRFAVPEGFVGLADPYIATRLAPRVGMTRAKWLILTGEAFGGEQALAWGMVNEVVEEDDLRQRLEDIAITLSAIAPNSLAEYKRAINSTLSPFDMQVMLRGNGSPYAAEGVSAFIEKRKPNWASVNSVVKN